MVNGKWSMVNGQWTMDKMEAKSIFCYLFAKEEPTKLAKYLEFERTVAKSSNKAFKKINQCSLFNATTALGYFGLDQIPKFHEKSVASLFELTSFKHFPYTSLPTNNESGGQRLSQRCDGTFRNYTQIISSKHAGDICATNASVRVARAFREEYDLRSDIRESLNATIRNALDVAFSTLTKEKKDELLRRCASFTLHNAQAISARQTLRKNRGATHPIVWIDLFHTASLCLTETGGLFESFCKQARLIRMLTVNDHDHPHFSHETVPQQYDLSYKQLPCHDCREEPTQQRSPISLQHLAALSLHQHLQMRFLEVEITADNVKALGDLPKPLTGFIQNFRLAEAVPRVNREEEYEINSFLPPFRDWMNSSTSGMMQRHRRAVTSDPLMPEPQIAREVRKCQMELLVSENLMAEDPARFVIRTALGPQSMASILNRAIAYACVCRRRRAHMGSLLEIHPEHIQLDFQNVDVHPTPLDSMETDDQRSEYVDHLVNSRELQLDYCRDDGQRVEPDEMVDEEEGAHNDVELQYHHYHYQ